MKIKISDSLSFPADLVTQMIAVLARRGGGKSYCGAVIAEELHKNHLYFVVLDPIGNWYGLRLDEDGVSKGLDITIFGGDRADIPITATAGAILADTIVNERISAILDLSHFKKGEQDRFVCDFAERLYRINREPLHLIVDEADSFIPQKPQPGQQRMLGAMEDLARRGRARGIGMTLISQRSAVINKNVLSQAEVLICLQTTSPHDRDAIEWWTEANGTKEQRDTMMSSLASLPVGVAWVWSPQWAQVFEKVKIRRRRTFDSGATPKAGMSSKPRTLTPIDVEHLKKSLAATVAQAEADNPRALKKRISDLERELSVRPTTKAEVKTIVEYQVPESVTSVILNIVGILDTAKQSAAGAHGLLRAAMQDIDKINKKKAAIKPDGGMEKLSRPQELYDSAREAFGGPSSERVRELAASALAKPARVSLPGDLKITGGLKRILIALAQRRDGLTKKQIGVRSQLSSKSGTFTTYMSTLRASDFVVGEDGVIKITEKGLSELGKDYELLPAGEALKDYWKAHLGGGAARMLEVLWRRRTPITKYELAEMAAISPNSGTFTTYLSTLRTLELIEGKSDALKASEELY